MAGRILAEVTAAKKLVKAEADMPVEAISIPVEGVLLQEGDKLVLLSEEDYASSHPEADPVKLRNELLVPFGGTVELVCFLAQHVFGKGDILDSAKGPIVKLDEIQVRVDGEKAIFNWPQHPKLDIMADQFSFLLFQFPND